MTKLSPASQAVRDNYGRALFTKQYAESGRVEIAIAAALRAAAEIVAPLSYEDVWTDGRMLQYEKYDPIREKLLIIADELEAQ